MGLDHIQGWENQVFEKFIKRQAYWKGQWELNKNGKKWWKPYIEHRKITNDLLIFNYKIYKKYIEANKNSKRNGNNEGQDKLTRYFYYQEIGQILFNFFCDIIWLDDEWYWDNYHYL